MIESGVLRVTGFIPVVFCLGNGLTTGMNPVARKAL